MISLFSDVEILGLDVHPIALFVIVAGFLCLIWSLIRAVSDSRWLWAYFPICFLLALFISFLYGHPQ